MILFASWLYISLLFMYLYEKIRAKIFFLISVFVLIVLAGIRTNFNDTLRYIYNFIYRTPNNLVDFFNNFSFFDLGSYPGFIFFQTILKEYFINDPYFFLFITSFIINLSIVLLYKRLINKYVTLVIFLYIFSGLYVLGMAAIKQMMAISIGIWGIYFYLKNKYTLFIVLIFIASLFHPYALIYLSVIFFDKSIWDKKTYIMLFSTILIGIGFNYIMSVVVENLNELGLNYDVNYITNAPGMNPLRVVFYSFIPILSFIYRKEILKINDKLLFVSVNFSVLTFVFMAMGLYGGANMFGRLGSYFEIFSYISIAKILTLISNKYVKFFIILFLIMMYTIFFYYQYVIVRNFNYRHLDFNIL